MVMEFAVLDRKDQIDLAKSSGTPAGPIAPIALFAHYHGELFKLIESGKVTEKAMRNLYRANTELWSIILEIDAKRKAEGL